MAGLTGLTSITTPDLSSARYQADCRALASSPEAVVEPGGSDQDDVSRGRALGAGDDRLRALNTRPRLAEAQLDETRGAEERRTVEVVAERLPNEAGIGIQHHPFRIPARERWVPDGRDDLDAPPSSPTLDRSRASSPISASPQRHRTSPRPPAVLPGRRAIDTREAIRSP